MRFVGLGAFVITVMGVVSFSHFIVTLFGKDIPDVMISFFKGAEEVVVVGFVLVFVLAWMRRAQPRRRGDGGYSVVVFDVFDRQTRIHGLRTEFGTYDVAVSFVRQYKHDHPLHSFAIVSGARDERARPVIVRYI